MENIARSLAQRILPSWDLRLAVLFPFILDGNGRRCSARSPAFRAHLRIETICSTAFLQNQSENFGFISIGPGDNYEPTRSMRDRLIWKGYRPGHELFYLAFPEAKHDENAWAARSPIPFQFLFGNLPRFSKSRQSKVGPP